MKDNICVITTVHYCFDTRIYYREITSLSKKYIVDYYAPCNEIIKLECSRTFSPLYSSMSKLGRIKAHLQLIYLLLKKNYSMYHLHDPELIPLGLLLKIAKKRVIFDMHENVFIDISTKKYLHPWLRKIIYISFKFLYDLAQRKFDWFILAESSYSKIMKSSKYEIIYNYPLLKNIEIPREKKWKYGMVYVGSITVDRGIWNMLFVFQKVQNILPGSSLHLIGPIDEKGLDLEIAEWICNNSLSGKVYLHGRIPNEQIFDIVRHNSIGLCLLNKTVSFQESLPTKMFEYMMVSLPVIITNCDLWKDIVEDNKCGIAIDPDRHQESADKIVYLLKDDKLLKEFGNNGLKAVQTKFNWANEEVKLLNIYSYLIK